MRAGLAAAFLVLTACPARCADGPECFSRATRFNICEKAREMQAQLAQALPMPISRNLILAGSVVAGPRIIVTALWNVSRDSYGKMLIDSGAQVGEMPIKMDVFTRNSVCGQDFTAAFVRLGGEIQYLYKTTDGFVAFSPLVADCP